MRVLVSGGGGFLGFAIVKMLLAEGYEVRSFSRNSYPQLAALGVEQHRGDLCDPNAVASAVAGCQLVFHVAALAGVWGSHSAYYNANVLGTRHLLEASRKQAVARLIYTSSPSVVFDGQDQRGVEESAPYPERYLAAYPATKAEAERLVLAANCDRLATVALRPHLIWGPGDPHLVPRILARARAGRLALIGDGENLVDAVFVDNAAAAHLAAARVLHPGAACAGKAYFVTNDQPIPMRELLNRILCAGGLPPLKKQVSASLAYFAGYCFEGLYRILGRLEEPPMTRFVARQLATAHWFSQKAIVRDMQYKPMVSMEEGFERLKRALSENLDAHHP